MEDQIQEYKTDKKLLKLPLVQDTESQSDNLEELKEKLGQQFRQDQQIDVEQKQLEYSINQNKEQEQLQGNNQSEQNNIELIVVDDDSQYNTQENNANNTTISQQKQAKMNLNTDNSSKIQQNNEEYSTNLQVNQSSLENNTEIVNMQENALQTGGQNSENIVQNNNENVENAEDDNVGMTNQEKLQEIKSILKQVEVERSKYIVVRGLLGLLGVFIILDPENNCRNNGFDNTLTIFLLAMDIACGLYNYKLLQITMKLRKDLTEETLNNDIYQQIFEVNILRQQNQYYRTQRTISTITNIYGLKLKLFQYALLTYQWVLIYLLVERLLISSKTYCTIYVFYYQVGEFAYMSMEIISAIFIVISIIMIGVIYGPLYFGFQIYKFVQNWRKKQENKILMSKIPVGTYKDVKSQINCEECIICLGNYNENDMVIILNCGQTNSNAKHNFHDDCLKQWINKHMHCPVCRKNISIENYQ